MDCRRKLDRRIYKKTILLKPVEYCNLACRYCYVNPDLPKRKMDFKVIKRLKDELDSLYEAGIGIVDLIWHGGEPTLYGLKNMKRAVEHLSKSKIRIRWKIQTNGTLISEDWVKFFREYNFSVGVSIDGHKELHDKNRIYFNGKGSFEEAYRGFKMLKEGNVRVGILSVATKYTLNEVDKFYEFIRRQGVGVRVNPFFASGRGKDKEEELGLTNEEYAKLMIALYDKWKDDVVSFRLSPIEEIVESMITGRNPNCNYSFKGCNYDFISIDPKGDVYSCARLSGVKEAYFGNLEEGILYLYSKSLKRTKVDEECLRCKWFRICGGGCPAISFYYTGDFNKREPSCEGRKKVFEYIYKDLKRRGVKNEKVYMSLLQK